MQRTIKNRRTIGSQHDERLSVLVRLCQTKAQELVLEGKLAIILSPKIAFMLPANIACIIIMEPAVPAKLIDVSGR